MTVGDIAPDFTLYSNNRTAFHLASQEKPVVLLFFPGAYTSVCTTELNEVSNDLAAYGDATVLGVSTDSPFVLSAWAKENAFAFDLLSDHDAMVSAAYGSKYDNDFTPMHLDRISKRSAFVIDRDRIVRYAEVLDNAGQVPDLSAVKAAVASL